MNDRSRRWALTCSDPRLLDSLRPLLEVRSRLGPVTCCATLDEALVRADCVLMVGGNAPVSAIVSAADGRRVAVGWVASEREALIKFARTAAAVAAREVAGLSSGPAVLLAQWDDRALQLADELDQLGDGVMLRWTAERIVRRDLLEAMRCGPGVAVYLGHALCGGWVGYGGITAA